MLVVTHRSICSGSAHPLGLAGHGSDCALSPRASPLAAGSASRAGSDRKDHSSTF